MREMSPTDDTGLDDEQLTRYLLGLLPREQAERIDEAGIVDDAVAARLRTVEHDLVDAYVRGALSRELRMCYSALALVTDMDAGAEGEAGVGQEEVFALFRSNLERLTGLLATAVAALPDPEGCSCSTWADGIELTYDIP